MAWSWGCVEAAHVALVVAWCLRRVDVYICVEQCWFERIYAFAISAPSLAKEPLG